MKKGPYSNRVLYLTYEKIAENPFESFSNISHFLGFGQLGERSKKWVEQNMFGSETNTSSADGHNYDTKGRKASLHVRNWERKFYFPESLTCQEAIKVLYAD